MLKYPEKSGNKQYTQRRHKQPIGKYIPVLSLSLLLTACGQPNHLNNSGPAIQHAAGAPLPAVSMSLPPSEKVSASGKARLQPDPQHPGRAQMSVHIRLSPPQNGLHTQGLMPSRFQRANAQIVLSNDGSEKILADGANPEGYVAIQGDELELQFSGVPYGKGRLLEVILDTRPIDGSTPEDPVENALIGNVFDLSTTTADVEISYRTTPVALMFMPGSELWEPYRLGAFALTDLQAFVDQITGKTGSVPYTYANCHPILVNTDLLRQQFASHNFQIAALNPADYRFEPGTLTGTISGLVSTDTIHLRVTDPSSPVLNAQSNGSYTISQVAVNDLGAMDPWYHFSLLGTVSGGTSYTISYQPDSGLSLSAGNNLSRNIQVVPATPVLSSLSASSGTTGSLLTLSGSNFHASPDGNVVRFGEVTVPTEDITVHSSTELTAKVPSTVSGTVDVTVAVGSQISSPKSFTVSANDAGKILFVSDRDGNNEIYAMNEDGSAQTRLTSSTGDDRDPAMSPDGSRIVFVSNRDGVYKLYVMNADGGHPILLANQEVGPDPYPRWSPDGSKILFADGAIQIIDSNGANLTSVPAACGIVKNADWSPDGNKLVFECQLTPSHRDFYQSNADGGGQVRLSVSDNLVSGLALDKHPVYSPDGRLLAFNDNGEEVAKASLETGGITYLTYDTPRRNQNVSWSPVGNRLVFQSTSLPDGGVLHIDAIDPDGGNRVRLTDNIANNSQPFWYHPMATPEIASLSSSVGHSGETITINGSHFSPVTDQNVVKFGDTEVPATDVSYISPTQLSVKVPADASGNAPISVRVSNKISNSLPFTVNIQPVISSLSASSGRAGELITLNGLGFSVTAAQNVIKFGNVTVPAPDITVNSSTQLTVKVPYGALGDASITAEVEGQISAPQNFTVRVDGPYGVSADAYYQIHQLYYNPTLEQILTMSSRWNGSAYTLDFFHSVDQGKSWSSFNLGQGVTNGSELYLGQNDQRLFAFWTASSQIFLRKSDDSGNNWSSTINVTSSQFGGGGEWAGLPHYACINGVNYLLIQARKSGIISYYLYTFDNNLNFSAPMIIPGDASKSNGVKLFGQGSNLYVLYDDAFGTNNLWLIKSTDGGVNFSSPVRVNRTLNAPPTGYAPAIDSQGHVLIAYGDTSTDGSGDLYLARSADGGNSFTYIAVASSTQSSQRSPSIAVDQADQIHVIWTDERSAIPELYHAMSRDHGLSFEADYSLGQWLGYAGSKNIVPLNDGKNTLLISADQRGADTNPYLKLMRYFAKPEN